MRRLILLWFCCLGSTGCAVNQLQTDQDKIRCALLELYTDQLMDNLVRAANGLPIIHLDYGTAQATVTTMSGTMASDGYAVTRTHTLMEAAASTLTASRMAVNTFMGNANHDNKNMVAVTATPLTGSVEAYNAYLQFLAIPGSLQAGPAPPPPGAAHVCKKCGKVYYWIPVEFRGLFLDLALATTSERGRLLVPTPEFYTVSLLEVLPKESGKEGRVVVRIDQSIPNDTGHVEFSDGKTLRLVEYEPPQAGARFFETDRLAIYLDPAAAPLGIATQADLEARLQQGPIAVKVHLDKHKPLPPTRAQLLDMIPFQSLQLPGVDLSADGH